MFKLPQFPTPPGYEPPPAPEPTPAVYGEPPLPLPPGMFPKPTGLLPMASFFWDSVLQQDKTTPHTPTEWVVLALACKWLSEAEMQLKESRSVPAGIATDKVLNIVSKFGFTPADREKAGVTPAKPKPAPRRKRSTDELTPDQITKQLASKGVIPETRIIPGMEEEPTESAE